MGRAIATQGTGPGMERIVHAPLTQSARCRATIHMTHMTASFLLPIDRRVHASD
jgi:hypothetical protein